MQHGHFISASFFLLLLGLLSAGCDETNSEPDNTPPRAKLETVPLSGDSTTVFVLSSQRSADTEDALSWLWFRWNLNGDSIWDTGYEQYAYKVERYPETGYHTVIVEVKDRFGLTDTASVTVETWGKNPDSGSFTDPRDNQQYKTIKIGNNWWMAENLNYGLMIPDTQKAMDNNIAEKYCYLNDSSLRMNPGGYYTYYDWEELMDYDTLSVTGLCPPGWSIPAKKDWQQLLDSLGYRGYYTYLAGDGYSGLSLTLTGLHILTKSWDANSANPDLTQWKYLLRNFSTELYGGKFQHCPYGVSSDRGVFLLRAEGGLVQKNKAALPVRCIRYANN